MELLEPSQEALDYERCGLELKTSIKLDAIGQSHYFN